MSPSLTSTYQINFTMIKCGYLIGKSKELWSSSLETINRFNDNTDYTQWIEEKQRKWEKDPAKSLEMTPLPEVDMDGTLVGKHLLLGMTLAETIDFLKRIDFPFWYCSTSDGEHHHHECTYFRDKKILGWVTKQYGPVKYFKEGDRSTEPRGNESDSSMPYGFRVGSPDPRSLTGYDLVHVIRRWLESVDKQKFSVCEILLEEKKTAPNTCTREEAKKRKPYAYISHEQSEHIGDTLKYSEKGCSRDIENELGRSPLGDIHNLYCWVDYFVLRQYDTNESFNIPAMEKVVAKTGRTIVLLVVRSKENKKSLSFFKRSFCVYEVCCTYIVGAKMVVSGTEDLPQYIQQNPVKTKNSESFRKKDKKQIDQFVKKNMKNGFAGLDEKITKTILDTNLEDNP